MLDESFNKRLSHSREKRLVEENQSFDRGMKKFEHKMVKSSSNYLSQLQLKKKSI